MMKRVQALPGGRAWISACAPPVGFLAFPRQRVVRRNDRLPGGDLAWRMRPETVLREDISLFSPPGPLIDDPVEFFIEFLHRFPLLHPCGFYFLAQAFVGPFLIRLPTFQSGDIILQRVISRHARCGEAGHRNNSAEGQSIVGRAAPPLSPLCPIHFMVAVIFSHVRIASPGGRLRSPQRPAGSPLSTSMPSVCRGTNQPGHPLANSLSQLLLSLFLPISVLALLSP